MSKPKTTATQENKRKQNDLLKLEKANKGFSKIHS